MRTTQRSLAIMVGALIPLWAGMAHAVTTISTGGGSGTGTGTSTALGCGQSLTQTGQGTDQEDESDAGFACTAALSKALATMPLPTCPGGTLSGSVQYLPGPNPSDCDSSWVTLEIYNYSIIATRTVTCNCPNGSSGGGGGTKLQSNQ